MSSVPLACTNGKSNNVPNDKHVIPSLDQIGNGKPLQMALDMLDQLGPLHNNNNNNNNNNSDGGIHWLPPGFRFHPTDEELVSFYLVQKMHNPNSFAHHPAISEVDLNKCEPWDLPGQGKFTVLKSILHIITTTNVMWGVYHIVVHKIYVYVVGSQNICVCVCVCVCWEDMAWCVRWRVSEHKLKKYM